MFEDVEIATSFHRRLTGLMLKRRVPEGYALVFPNCRSVHGMFMRIPIDVAFLDSENRVLDTSELKPWRVAIGPKDACSTLECAEGVLGRMGARKGDRLF